MPIFSVDFILSVAAALMTLLATVWVVAGGRKMRRLADTPACINEFPSVSIIVSALNEATTIEAGLKSLLALDYPDLQIVAVNDRSTDATPDILNAMKSESCRLEVVHVDQLPSGWLGKNHALHLGAQRARGDFLLFTDADVVLDRNALRRAVSFCIEQRLDHLSLFPQVPVHDPLLALLLLQFGVGFLLRFQPWKLRESPSHFMGQGAFNLVRRTAYVESGGHAAIRMAVIDDMMLGWLIKRHGFRQDALLGQEFVSVRWYFTPAQMFRGLRKNIFAGFDYSLLRLFSASLLLALCGIWPWIGLAMAGTEAKWLNLGSILMMLALYAGMARMNRWRLTCLAYLPVIAPLTLLMWWQASMLALWNGGIDWRGTFYSLDALKKAHPFR